MANLLEEKDDIKFTFPSSGNVAQAFNRLISAVEKAPAEAQLVRPTDDSFDRVLILLCLIDSVALSKNKTLTFDELIEASNQLIERGQLRTWGQIVQAEKAGKILFRGIGRRIIKMDFTILNPIGYYTFDKIDELQQDIPCLILQNFRREEGAKSKSIVDDVINYVYRFSPSFTSVDKKDSGICHRWGILPFPKEIRNFEIEHKIIFQYSFVRLAEQMTDPAIVGACQRLLDIMKLPNNFLPVMIAILTRACKKDWIKGNPSYKILNYALAASLEDRSASEGWFNYQDLKLALMALSARSTFIKEQIKQEEELKRLYAKSFTPLRNNTKKATEIAQNSNFAQFFPEVELDGTGTREARVKYEEFDKINQEFPAIIGELPSGGTLPALRFRKLGNHHATGLYFPLPNCICIDVRDTSSFIHEYGHYVDYQMLDRFSITADFLPFVVEYSNFLKNKTDISTRMIKYFSSPAEVFARCFESYYYSQYCDNSDDNPWNDFCQLSPHSSEYKYIFEHLDEVSEILESAL